MRARASGPTPAPPAPPGRPLGLAALVLLVGGLVAAVHAPVLDSQALALDDHLFVARNPLVQRPGWPSVGRFFGEVLNPSTVSAYYTPLSMTSLMLDVALGGRPDDLRVFHVTQLVLHGITTVLVLLILRRLLGSLIPAALAALLFGLHPLAVEPVASVGERKTLLAAAFALASMLAYLRSVDTRRRVWNALAIASFALALLAKPSVTPLPLLLLLLDHWPLRRLSWATVREKWPFFALAAASSVITVLAVARTWELGALPASNPARTTLQICYLLGFYLGKLAWPVDLSCVYAPPAAYTLADPRVAVGVAVTLALVVVLVRARRGSPGIGVGLGVFLLALVPTFGILRWSSVIAYDRYVYFPALGIAIVAGVALAAAWRAPWLRRPAARAALVAVVLALAAAEARGVRAALVPWRDSLAIWRHIVARAPETPDAHNGLGVTLAARYAPEEAVAAFRRAVEADPGYLDARVNLGGVLTDLGRTGEAIPHLEWATARVPRSAKAAWMLGLAYKGARRLDEAAAQFRRALELEPDDPRAATQLGLVALLQGRSSEGIATLRRAVAGSPGEAEPRFGLALALLRVRGLDAEVLGLMRQAVALGPNWSAPMNHLAWLLATLPDSTLRDPGEAVRLAERAVALTYGRDAGVLDTQAAALAAAGRFEDAIRSGEAAVALAEQAHDDSLAAGIRERLAKYARRRSHLEPVPARH